MLSNVFLKSLRDQRRSFTFWAIGVTGLTILTVLFYPAISKTTEFSEILAESEALAQIFSGGFTDITSPDGYLNSQLFSLLVPILLLIFSINLGSGYIAGEEGRGTLDLLLSNPITRTRVLAQKLAAMVVATAALGVVLWLSIVIGALMVDMDIRALRVLEACVSGVLLGTAFGAVALALGAATGKRGIAIGVSGAVALVAYLINSMAPLVEGLEQAVKVSPFHYYIGADPLANGLDPVHVAVLVLVTTALSLFANYAFNRRDLGV